MLKEDTTLSLGWRPGDSGDNHATEERYEYVRVRSSRSPSTDARRAAKPKHLVLPVRVGFLAQHSSLPLQSYLRERFAHIGGKDNAARNLRAENQRRHDHCASLGHWQMSRTS